MSYFFCFLFFIYSTDEKIEDKIIDLQKIIEKNKLKLNSYKEVLTKNIPMNLKSQIEPYIEELDFDIKKLENEIIILKNNNII